MTERDAELQRTYAYGFVTGGLLGSMIVALWVLLG